VRLSVAIVTSDVRILREFYTTVLSVTPTGDENYAEFRCAEDWVIAMCSLDSIEFAAPGAHIPATNRCVRIELEVADVDAEFERLRDVVGEWIVPPTDWPWGTRATWFRDPDGNLISLFEIRTPPPERSP
jgi:predicted enzyme related to lactoylglutathione lyase